MYLEKLARQYLNNSSFSGAVVGKAARALLRITNSARVFRYDATLSPPMLKIATHEPMLFPVCFTCGKHFEFIRLALLSLGKVSPKIGEVFIFMDRGGPLSEVQQDTLRTACRYPISFSTTAYPMRYWGPKYTLSHAIAFREVAGRMSNQDFMMKFDSDVIFVDDKIMNLVLKSTAGAVGTHVGILHGAEAAGKDFMQGGCYFIRGSELMKMISCRLGQSVFTRTKWGAIGEDQFFSRLLRKLGTDIRYENYLYSEPIFIQSNTKQEDLEARLKLLPAHVDVLHFEGNQDDIVDRTNMAKTYHFFYGDSLKSGILRKSLVGR